MRQLLLFLAFCAALPLLPLALFGSYVLTREDVVPVRSPADVDIARLGEWMKAFQAEQARMPTPREVDDATTRLDPQRLGGVGNGFWVDWQRFPAALTRRFGHPPPNAFYMGFFDGDNFVDVASWQPDKNVAVVDDSNDVFGGRREEGFALLGGAGALLLLSLSLHHQAWRRKNRP